MFTAPVVQPLSSHLHPCGPSADDAAHLRLLTMRKAQQPHLLPCTNATVNGCLPLMQLPCLLTSVLPQYFLTAVGTVLIWLLVSILGWMPLRCHLWYQLSHRLARAHSLASAVGTSVSIYCPIMYRGLPLSKMRAGWWVIVAVEADPHRSDHAARGQPPRWRRALT